MASRENYPVQTRPTAIEVRSPKNRVFAFLMAFFFGVFGVHRFYVGKFWTGLALLFTGGGFGIWWIIDAIIILLGRFKDAEGRVLGPPQYEYRQIPAHQAPSRTVLDLETEKDDEDVVFEDPLEAEFAQLEREMKAGKHKS
ncbi:MAG: TM2 domain-containing protein [Bradymonadaceae bacterium]